MSLIPIAASFFDLTQGKLTEISPVAINPVEGIIAAGAVVYLAHTIAMIFGILSGYMLKMFYNPRTAGVPTEFHARVKAAEANGFETYPQFVAAVLLGIHFGVDELLLSQLVTAHVASRLAYTIWYIFGNLHSTLGPVRTAFWMMGQYFTYRIMVLALVASPYKATVDVSALMMSVKEQVMSKMV